MAMEFSHKYCQLPRRQIDYDDDKNDEDENRRITQTHDECLSEGEEINFRRCRI
jgi:hypothetical protein